MSASMVNVAESPEASVASVHVTLLPMTLPPCPAVRFVRLVSRSSVTLTLVASAAPVLVISRV